VAEEQKQNKKDTEFAQGSEVLSQGGAAPSSHLSFEIRCALGSFL